MCKSNEINKLNVVVIMAKSGNNENKIEKLVRVGFYELEKTIGKRKLQRSNAPPN